MSDGIQEEQGGASLVLRTILASFATLFGVTMFVIAPSAEKPMGHYLFGVFCLGIAAVCFVQGRAQRIIGSFIAASVVAVTVWYLIVELFGGTMVSGSLSRPSIVNALLALAVFGFPAMAYLRQARFGFGPEPVPAQETIETDEGGIVRIVGAIREKIRWDDVEEIRIFTTSDGPFSEDVFFALIGAEKNGCLISNEAAVRYKLLEQLQSRFKGMDDAAVIKAMGCTSNDNFLIWKKPSSVVV